MKVNRRHFLLAGLGTGLTVSGATEQARIHQVRAQQDRAARKTLAEHLSIMDAAYASELVWDEEVEKRKELLAFTNLTPPTLPYDRDMSKRMIQLCKLAVQQFKTKRSNPNYDGSIDVLPDYRRHLDIYNQLTNFTATQDIIEDYFKGLDNNNVPVSTNDLIGDTSAGQSIKNVELTLRDEIRQILQHRHRITVYSGLALTSSDHNVLVFRGTQTQSEWLKNINASQVDYVSPTGQFYGAVHEGFYQVTQEIQPSIAEIAQQLDPSIPCYVTGHSLGAAIATLAAFELVQAVPELKDQIRLYTFAGPRVASPTFATLHSQLIPNAYRIVNVGDTVPLIPPVTMGNTYTHVGQEWSFLAQFGDTLLNHVVDTYQIAVDQEVETDQILNPMQPLQLG
ncbi:MAG: lipase family protein [Cyanobacteria bacterium P01_E01_bin.6]